MKLSENDFVRIAYGLNLARVQWSGQHQDHAPGTNPYEKLLKKVRKKQKKKYGKIALKLQDEQ